MRYAIVNPNGVTEFRLDSSGTLPDGAIEVSDDQYGRRDLKLVNGELVTDHNTVINEQITAIEEANPITHRTLREFIIGVSTGIAATQGVTPAQLLNPADPHYSHAFAAFVGVNQETVALRAQKT